VVNLYENGRHCDSRFEDITRVSAKFQDISSLIYLSLLFSLSFSSVSVNRTVYLYNQTLHIVSTNLDLSKK
jgi:hypothetical protein